LVEEIEIAVGGRRVRRECGEGFWGSLANEKARWDPHSCGEDIDNVYLPPNFPKFGADLESNIQGVHLGCH
jgi:hypothetical protein